MPEGAEGLDVNVTVAVGPHSVLPRMPLEMAPADPGVASDFHRARLVKGYGELRVLSTDLGLHFASMFFFLVGILTVLYAVWTLRRVLHSVLAGEPFAPVNSLRLRRIGFVVLALTILFPFAEYWIGRTVLERPTVEGLSLSPAFRFSTDGVLIGLLFLVLSTIFRHGAELEEERSLTV
jgi:hypothetical protein